MQNHINKFIINSKICLETKNEREPIIKSPLFLNQKGDHSFDHTCVNSKMYSNIIDSFFRYSQLMYIESKVLLV